MPGEPHPFQPSKLAELVLYIAERNLNNATFGKTKLHKQLWMSDFRHYGFTGKPITGATYVHRQHGPFCQELDQTLNSLEDQSKLEIRLRERFGYVQQHPVALKRWNLSAFTADEIAAVEDILWETWQMSAHELSERSHEHPGWRYTNDGEVISYEFANVPADLPFEEPYIPRQRPQAAADD